ncbi:MAG TPA: sulfite exporter TauE/SafE family protein [Pyrinomonadaceae bacterium]
MRRKLFNEKSRLTSNKCAALVLIALAFMFGSTISTHAHPLGNFTINHFTRLEVGRERVRVHYVIDMAEIATFQELQAADTDGDGAPSSAELKAYLEKVSSQYATGLVLKVNGALVPLKLIERKIATLTGTGGLPTLRIECDYEAQAAKTNSVSRLYLEDTNHRDRIGWREFVVAASDGMKVFDSNVFGSSVTDELKAYPQDMLTAPLDERVAELSFTSGAIPANAVALKTRDGRPVVQARDRLTELIAVPEITLWIALLGLLIAAGLGALHALSPGHGKTVVGAYLVGSRGTARHAAFLGLTVTVTHTLGVFALGLVTLFASRYVVPERLFPILSLVSGAIVLTIGLTLFVRRLRAALSLSTVAHHHHSHEKDEHQHEASDSMHSHDGVTHSHDGLMHSHGGGRAHTHLPPGADGSRVTWRGLLALGISGGLLPCPSALVVMLSAISLHRVGYGLLLVVAFSFGLACTLTGIGLAFVYAGRLIKRRQNSLAAGRLTRVVPALSALVIACIGAAICYEALVNTGFSLKSFLTQGLTGAGAVSTASVLLLGLVFGLKHAVEGDHLAAVSTIVSERKSLLSSTLVGGLWGIGHTISLLIAGVVVILLHVQIGERLSLALEFGVALMLITLGVNAIRKLARGGRLHFHTHQHGGHMHAHPHLHNHAAKENQATHHDFRLGVRPLLVGMVHGLAGSAALMLLVLSTLPTPLIGMAYITVFGIGSIGGMMLMSVLVGLPLRLTADRFMRANLTVRGLAGLFSLGFGLFMVYQIGFVEGLFR